MEERGGQKEGKKENEEERRWTEQKQKQTQGRN